MIDPIADMLTRIRNAVLVNKTDVIIPLSKVKFEVGKILEREGFIKRIEKIDESDKKRPFLRIILKYRDKDPVVREITRISKPGRRIYQGYKEMPKILPSLGILIVSTSRGLMTNTEAKQQKVGGEVICEIS
jgi:small subunit ribosomal protein S8